MKVLDKQKALETAIAQIEKQWGKGIHIIVDLYSRELFKFGDDVNASALAVGNVLTPVIYLSLIHI